MAEVKKLNVICDSPKATGYADIGEYNDNGATIVAPIVWKFLGSNPTTGPHEIQLLQQQVKVVSGEVGDKRLSATDYKVTKFGGVGSMTTLTKV